MNVHLKIKGTGVDLWFSILKLNSFYSFPNLKLIDFLSFLTFLIAYLILLECMIILSIYTDYFLSYFFVFIFSLYCLIRSKIILFSCLILSLNNLCWLVCGTLNETKLCDFLLSISYIFLTNERFSNITGSILSFIAW